MAHDQGFALAGVAPATPSPHGDYLDSWLTKGFHGEMDYLARHREMRLDLRKMVPGAKSVICVADFYPDQADSPQTDQPGNPGGGGAGEGRIARYAWGDDYHKVMKKRLFAMADRLTELWPTHTFRCAVDTAPIMEREHAVNAGLGWIGKHTLLIHPKLGSWMFLGEIVTTLDIQVPEDHTSAPLTDHCGSCTRCIDACPTKCIDPNGYKMDASRCISYLTIEHRGEIDSSLHESMGDWIAGCDICQEVCPFNAGVGDPGDPGKPGVGTRGEYAARPPGPVMALLDVLNWNAELRQKTLTRSALKRIKLDMWKRNALIAAGNYLAKHDNSELAERIKALAVDETETEMVRSTAKSLTSQISRGRQRR